MDQGEAHGVLPTDAKIVANDGAYKRGSYCLQIGTHWNPTGSNEVSNP